MEIEALFFHKINTSSALNTLAFTSFYHQFVIINLFVNKLWCASCPSPLCHLYCAFLITPSQSHLPSQKTCHPQLVTHNFAIVLSLLCHFHSAIRYQELVTYNLSTTIVIKSSPKCLLDCGISISILLSQLCCLLSHRAIISYKRFVIHNLSTTTLPLCHIHCAISYQGLVIHTL
jgi:hypothetical protein